MERNGIAEAVSKMCFGNMLGVSIKADEEILFSPEFGGFLLESESELDFEGAIYLGEVIKEPKVIVNTEEISLDKILKKLEKTA